LEAVATGLVEPDALRISACRALLPYSNQKARAPLLSPAPEKLRAATRRQAEQAAQTDWQEKSAAIRRKHGASTDAES